MYYTACGFIHISAIKELNNEMSFSTSENITAMQLPHAEAHISYLVEMDQISCSRLLDLEWTEICPFVMKNPLCHEFAWYINWLHLMFCQIKVHTLGFVTMIIVLCMITLTCSLALIIISFVRMAPCFIACAHYLKLDETVAGSIFLVFVTYLGDLVEDANLFDIESSTFYNELLGKAMVTIALFIGLLGYRFQFGLHPQYFLRDSLFVITSTILVTLTYMNHSLNIKYGLGFMAIYVAYLAYVLIEFLLNRRRYQDKSFQNEGSNTENLNALPQSITIKFEMNSQLQYDGELENPNKFLFKQFLTSLNPIRKEILGEMRKFYKICFIIGIPIHVLVILTIPCFDYKLPNHGWSKLLSCINLIVCCPLLTTLFKVNYIPYLVTWIPGAVLAVIVFCTSRTDRPPKYHLAFAFLGILMCMFYHAALEHALLNICHNLGHFLRLSRQTIGLSLLAWADNIALYVWITRLSEWGYYKTSFSAVHMSAMLDLVFCLGLIVTKKCWKSWSWSFTPRKGVSGPTSAVYLICVYIYILFGVSLCKFQMRKSLGASLIIIYLIYLLHSFLVEFEIIHGMGTDHALKTEYMGATWA